MDHRMPEKSGYQVLGEIRRDDNLKQIPVIIMSAKNFIPGEEDFQKAGATMFLKKPFNLQEIQHAVKSFLGINPGEIDGGVNGGVKS